MNSRLLLGGLLIFVCDCFEAKAQVAPPRPGQSWKVEILPMGMKTTWPPTFQRTTTNRNGGSNEVFVIEENQAGEGFLKQKIQTAPGQFLIRYVVKNLVIIQQENEKELQLIVNDGYAPGGPEDARFSAFAWVGPKWLVGEAQIDGVVCNVYRAPWPLPSEDNEKIVPPAEDGPYLLAAVGKDDRFPRRLENPYLIRRYVPQPASSVRLQLPAGARELIRQYENHVVPVPAGFGE